MDIESLQVRYIGLNFLVRQNLERLYQMPEADRESVKDLHREVGDILILNALGYPEEERIQRAEVGLRRLVALYQKHGVGSSETFDSLEALGEEEIATPREEADYETIQKMMEMRIRHEQSPAEAAAEIIHSLKRVRDYSDARRRLKDLDPSDFE